MGRKDTKYGMTVGHRVSFSFSLIRGLSSVGVYDDGNQFTMPNQGVMIKSGHNIEEENVHALS
jgi:hypothetical protein